MLSAKIKILDIDKLLLIENEDSARVNRLKNSFRNDRIIKNPPIVAFNNNLKKYIVLDGTNRIFCLRSLGVMSVPVQICDYFSSKVSLETWTHNLLEPRNLWTIISNSFELNEISKQDFKLLPPKDFSFAIFWKDRFFYKRRNLHIEDVIEIFSIYGKSFDYLRSPNLNYQDNLKNYPLIFLYSNFSKEDIFTLSEGKIKTPSGITRHIISDRVLNLNVEIALLRSKIDINSKNEYLKEKLKEISSSARIYEESTIILSD